MLSLPIGMIAMGITLAVVLTGLDLGVLLNAHAIVLVIGGTISVLALTAPTAGIRSLFGAILDLRKTESSLEELGPVLLALSKNRDAKLKFQHPLIEHAQSLWEQGLDEDTVSTLMAQKLGQLNRHSSDAVTTLRNLAKYPPALGMMGTVLGLVSLFANLTPDKRALIGPNLALALTATFYGLLLANAVIMPIADRLQVSHQAKVKINQEIYKILMLIHEGHPSGVIQEELSGSAPGGAHGTRAA